MQMVDYDMTKSGVATITFVSMVGSPVTDTNFGFIQAANTILTPGASKGDGSAWSGTYRLRLPGASIRRANQKIIGAKLRTSILPLGDAEVDFSLSARLVVGAGNVALLGAFSRSDQVPGYPLSINEPRVDVSALAQTGDADLEFVITNCDGDSAGEAGFVLAGCILSLGYSFLRPYPA